MKADLDTEPAAYIQAEWFPVTITTDSKSTVFHRDDFKMVVTDNYFYAILDHPKGPELEIKEPLVSLEGSRKDGYTVTTEAMTYYITKTAHCACGSRLRGFLLFSGVPHIAQAPQLKKK